MLKEYYYCTIAIISIIFISINNVLLMILFLETYFGEYIFTIYLYLKGFFIKINE